MLTTQQTKPSYRDQGRIRALAKQLDKLGDDYEAKKMAITDYLQEFTSKSQANEFMRPSNKDMHEELDEYPYDLAIRHGVAQEFNDWVLRRALMNALQPFERLPCANMLREGLLHCRKEGTLACSQCKLQSEPSSHRFIAVCAILCLTTPIYFKECQRSHWSTHKANCKSPLRASDWKPQWIKENRKPDFGMKGPRIIDITVGAISSIVISIMIAMPKLGQHTCYRQFQFAQERRRCNKKETYTGLHRQVSYRSALIARSADIPNVIRTVNELPSNFSGELVVLLNAHNEPLSLIRSVIALLILTSIEDVTQAAEAALQFWTSAFVQSQHSLIHTQVVDNFLRACKEDASFFLSLGKNSSIRGLISEETYQLLGGIHQSRVPFNDAVAEHKRIWTGRTKDDKSDRHLCHLEPSHRQAFRKSQTHGYTNPFGGPVVVGEANRSLFSPQGEWLQDDLASPIDEWNIEEIVATGPAYGCQTADIFGCLYFYLSEQFRKFTGRLREFKIQFKFVDKNSHVIADYLKGGIFSKIGLTENTVFDRIDMSNLADNEKTGGIAGVLKDWAPFVNKKNRNATLFGHSTGWVTQQRKGQPGPTEMQALTLQLLSKGKLDAKKMQPDLIPAWFKYYVALYDNSAAFEEWLTKQGVDEAAKKAGLKRKKKHTIVPHRIGGRLGDLPDALPHFPTDDSWYWNVQVSQTSLSERFFEFGIA
ncbi:LOW QUALITY PROTEIN: hypothetical protein CVT26_004738 [Gymnopilus dilepis]|uniref:DUF4470 domain-containing protein n=1 Tax=Gymnopilus dilepis TaxID=231916 RepID=A0A409XZ93_9AGAR|nr:LOW QUALITY PROTEIN: hypothetical protein CVT26_004738 [Gymnopilus dilepis]